MGSHRISARTFYGDCQHYGVCSSIQCPKYIETLDNTWITLRTALVDFLQQRNLRQLSFEKLYTFSYYLIINRLGSKLYDMVKEIFRDHLEMHVRQKALDDLRNNNPTGFSESWSVFFERVKGIRDILMYMDRVYVQERGQLTVQELSRTFFVKCIIQNDDIRERVQQFFLLQIDQERRGISQDKMWIKDACVMLLELKMANDTFYEDYFESAFLEECAIYYSSEAQSYWLENSVSTYARNAIQLMEKEKQIVEQFLDASSKEAVQKVLIRELVANFENDLFGVEKGGVATMLENYQFADLACVYKLFDGVPEKKRILLGMMADLLRDQGAPHFAKIQDIELNPIDFVQDIMKLRGEQDKLFGSVFSKDIQFTEMVTGVLQHFLDKIPELPKNLAVLVNQRLACPGQISSNGEFSNWIDAVLFLYSFLEEKPLFQLLYHRDLAVRLLGNQSVDLDLEKTVVGKIKQSDPYATRKMEGMLADFQHNILQNRLFVSSPRGNCTSIHVSVITKDFWPFSSPEHQIILPESLHVQFDQFQQFHSHRTRGRPAKLSVHPDFGTAEILARFGNASRTITLKVSTCQLCVLMVFNTRDMMTMDEIFKATSIPLEKLKVILLQFTSKGLLTASGEEFSFNNSFDHPGTLLELSSGVSAEDFPDLPEMRKRVNNEPEFDQRYLIEAAIVRIMKSAKSLSSPELIERIGEQLTRPRKPSPSTVRKCLDRVVEKEYIAKDNSDRYTYLP